VTGRTGSECQLVLSEGVITSRWWRSSCAFSYSFSHASSSQSARLPLPTPWDSNVMCSCFFQVWAWPLGAGPPAGSAALPALRRHHVPARGTRPYHQERDSESREAQHGCAVMEPYGSLPGNCCPSPEPTSSPDSELLLSWPDAPGRCCWGQLKLPPFSPPRSVVFRIWTRFGSALLFEKGSWGIPAAIGLLLPPTARISRLSLCNRRVS